MARARDPFADFERMRREMAELFGGVLGRSGLVSRRAGFSPSVDVYYCADPPRAVVTAELAGVDPDSLSLEVHGRDVVISGRRHSAGAQRRVYQQLEIGHGPFRRVVTLGADVRPDSARADYENGILRVELPLAGPASRSRSVPIAPARERSR